MIFSWSRFTAVLQKEFVQFRRDRFTFAILIGIPAALLLIYGYAIEIDARKLPTAVIDMSQDTHSREFITHMEMTDYFRLSKISPDPQSADRGMLAGDHLIIVTIPSDFGRRILRGEAAPVLVEADMSDAATAGGALSALEHVAKTFAGPEHGITAAAGLELVIQRRFNPEGIKHYISVTGLFGLLLEITVMIAAGHALARERERGTIENILATPVTAGELMLGKITPYVVLGAIEAMIILALALALFQVPFVGPIAPFALATLIFVTSAVLFGYTISTFVRTQIQAAQLIVFYLTLSIMLSGFTFPFIAMPAWARAVGELLPLTHFLRIARAIMLKGAEFSELSQEFACLSAYVVIFSVLSVWRFRRTLD